MSLSAQNHSYSDDENFVPKATPVAPSSDASMDVRPAKKADGAFRTISEVADELDVPQHVLRFWETKFTQVKPLKRGGGRRYYRPEDVSLLKHIHHLLYTEGYTIKGVQKLLKGQGKNQIAAQAEQMAATSAAPANVPKAATLASTESVGVDNSNVYNISDRQRIALEEMLGELKALRALIPQETV